MKSDGTGLKRLTNTPKRDESRATWSPDGKRLAIQRGYINDTERGSIALMDATPGAKQTLIRRNPRYVDGYNVRFSGPDWSPKGDQLAVTEWEIYDHSYPSLRLMSLTGKTGSCSRLWIRR